MRVESFTDAVPSLRSKAEMRLPGVPKDRLPAGRTWTYGQGMLDGPRRHQRGGGLSAWDKWVSDRVAQRDAAIAAVMEASGLTAPIPGMAEMDGQGKFFDCAPYGTCWEPKDAADDEPQAGAPNRARDGTHSRDWCWHRSILGRGSAQGPAQTHGSSSMRSISPACRKASATAR